MITEAFSHFLDILRPVVHEGRDRETKFSKSQVRVWQLDRCFATEFLTFSALWPFLLCMAAWLCRICLTLLPQEENGDVKHDNKDDERDDKSEAEEEEEEEAGKDAEKDDKDKSQVDKFDSDKESEEEKGAGEDSEKEDEAGSDLDDKANEADSEMEEEDEEGNEKAKKAKGEEKEDKEKEEEEEEEDEAVDKEELVDVRLNVVECCDIVFLCFGFNSMPAFLLLFASVLVWLLALCLEAGCPLHFVLVGVGWGGGVISKHFDCCFSCMLSM